jgi:hypothetical protein
MQINSRISTFLWSVLILAFSLSCGSKKDVSKISKKEIINTSPVQLNWPWRGITIVSHNNADTITNHHIDNLSEQGINFIRLRLSFRQRAEQDKIGEIESWTETINWAHNIIQACSVNGIDVLISHSDFPIRPNAKFNQTSSKFWNSRDELDSALITIRQIVSAFDTCASVKAYQFFAEPVVNDKSKPISPTNWLTFFEEIRFEVRTQSSKFIVFSPGPWGKSVGYKNILKPFEDTAIIYNFHFYEPHAYTHQMIKGNKKQYSYPGMINGTHWDIEKIQERMDIFSHWREKHNVKYALVGEFSAVRWAENNDVYINDVIKSLEERNISWAYFAYNSWLGWNYNYEHEPTKAKNINNLKQASSETKTLTLLKEYWKLNK